MDDLMDEISKLLEQGYNCSQIMLLLSLKLRNKENPELIQAMAGLGGGLHCRKTCGTLTGGCCLLASYGTQFPESDSQLSWKKLVSEYVSWFEQEFGSLNCEQIISGDSKNIPAVCPSMLEASFTRCMELLLENDIDINE